MSLNPVQFGTQVIDQFGRYLQTTFAIADRRLREQVAEELSHETGGERLIAKGPYAFLNRPFEPGPGMRRMIAEPGLGLHKALAGVFPYDTLHKHQELALRSITAGKHTVVATGTGSGKTEAFLMPIIDHALKLRDEGAEPGITGVIVYPMNALADDQLRRLRPLLAGTGVTFGRYTGSTPESPNDASDRLAHSRGYSEAELELLAQGRDSEVPHPFEECLSRTEIRRRRPRILLTNYQQLEYLLLRHRDLELFKGAPLRYLVFDEVHTYTGVLGSEVAALIRRLRHVAGKTASDVTCIGTSATVVDTEEIGAEEALTRFAHRLFGVPQDEIELVEEHYRDDEIEVDLYTPPPPKSARALLKAILQSVERLDDQPEGRDLPGEIAMNARLLCGRETDPAPTREAAVANLLQRNRVVRFLQESFSEPRLVLTVLDELRQIGDRKDVSNEDLLSEILTYLALGALVRKNGEPLLRPKLHYFVQGFQGLAVVFDAQAQPTINFNTETGHTADGRLLFPVHLCRSCGQHYYPVHASASEHAAGDDAGYRTIAIGPAGDEFEPVLLVDQLHTEDEDAKPLDGVTVCRYCGTIHSGTVRACGNLECTRADGLIPLKAHDGELKSCLACGAIRKGEVATPVHSGEVSDVTILGQSMLSSMPSEELRKLLIFCDNRQDAAFQAGWMEERGRRYRLRHLLYELLENDPERIWSLEKLAEELVERAIDRGILHSQGYNVEDNKTRVTWFLLEEFAQTRQRRLSLESLGLAAIEYQGLEASTDKDWFANWSNELEIEPEQLADLLHVMLDYYRRRSVLSDRLLKRRWSYRDFEVRNGLVSADEYFRPYALVNTTVEKDTYLKKWTATNGRGAMQVMLSQCLPESKRTHDFLDAAWHWLIMRGFLTSTQLLAKSYGKIQPLPISVKHYQIDNEKVGVRHNAERFVCSACRYVQTVATPNGRCPEYNCSGTLEHKGIDKDHYDVVQYTELDFAPLRTHEHSAQVPKPKREEIEAEFKREEGGRYNCLVATPTLEMGVDIGKLEMVMMRNVPPTPANYAQRSGRAGRRHRIAVVVTYCRGASHDRYFFERPSEMIAGRVRVPAISMSNVPLIRKHVHSTVLTYLRDAATDTERDKLDAVFPPFIEEYIFEERPARHGGTLRAYRKTPPSTESFQELLESHRDDLLATLREVFQAAWPEEDANAVTDAALARYLDEMPDELAGEIGYVFDRARTYRKNRDDLTTIQNERELEQDERATLKRYENALFALSDRARRENYTLSHLANVGFLPGYSMSNESITAKSLDPYLELFRPIGSALRELTPANRVYANGNAFAIRRLVFSRRPPAGGNTVLQREHRYFPSSERLIAKETQTHVGGQDTGFPIRSLPLAEVELRRQNTIDDNEDYRLRYGFRTHGVRLEQHQGGEHGEIGTHTYDLLNGQDLRLVNLGLANAKVPDELGFPLCPVCGATRHPNASDDEIEKFIDHHKLRCGEAPFRASLHAEFTSDVLILGPFPDRAVAVNVSEGILLGARSILDMNEGDIDAFIEVRRDDTVNIVLYDSMPGGSGFLPLLLEFWPTIIKTGTALLEDCPGECDAACYACLKSFRNQGDHGILDRHSATAWLHELQFSPKRGHPVPAVVLQPEIIEKYTDSNAELDFAHLCAQRGFPVPPVSQYPIKHGNATVTIADWAYPEDKVLVFIDGTSKELHGNPMQRQKDSLQRAKAKKLGYTVIEIPALALEDDEMVAFFFEEIANLLKHDYSSSVPDEESAPTSQRSASSNGWRTFIDDLLDEQWHDLARVLAENDVPPPDDAHVGLTRDGVVTEHLAVMLWKRGDTSVALVTREEAGALVDEAILISNDAKSAHIAEQVRIRLTAMEA